MHTFTVRSLALAIGVASGLFASGVWAQDAETLQTELAGSSEGAFTAGSGGSASFQVPIVVPPGAAGMQPSLAFVYDSRTKDSLLGAGWSVDGLATIVRCGATRAQDGVWGAIKFDANDRFCLGGRRLVAISGVYGADGAEYRTEIDDFTRIASYGSAGSGPRLFRAWLKSGRVLEFGGTEDSRIEAPGKASAYAWALNRVTDPSGNALTVTYQETLADGEYKPIRIDYTANSGAGLAPTRRVEFEYQARASVVVKYVAGSKIRLTSRLVRVAMYAGSQPAREYRLTYGTSADAPAGTGPALQDRLTTIRECGGGGGECLPVWSFGQTWGTSDIAQIASLDSAGVWRPDGSSGAKTLVADVNGDGLPDLIQVKLATNQAQVLRATGSGGFALAWTSPTAPTASGYVRSANAYTMALGDVNGDGRADLIQVGKTTAGVFVLLGNADGSFATAWTSPATGDGSVFTAERVVVQDFNGDGRADLMLLRNSTNQVRVLLSRGDGSFTTAWNSPPSPTVSGFLYGTSSAVSYAGDVNGDRIPDLVQITLGSNAARVVLGVGDGSFVTAWTSPTSTTADGFVRSIQSTQTVAGDFNGDGLMDLIQVMAAQNTAYVLLAKGDGSFTTAWTSPASSVADGWLIAANNALTLVGDVDGDGKADLVHIEKNLGRGRVLLSRGDGSFTTARVSATYPQPDFMWSAHPSSTENLVVDVTGDGSADLIQLRKAATGHQVMRTGFGLAGTLRQATNPLGRTLEIGWGSVTDPLVHSRESGSVYPTIDRPRPEAVVASTRSVDAAAPAVVSQTRYEYGGAKYDLWGRGSLGFRWRRVTEQVADGVAVTTFFAQPFPRTGSVEASTTQAVAASGSGYAATGPALRTTASLWTAAATSPASYFLRLDQADASDCAGGSPCRSTSQGFEYDAFGNQTRAHHFGDTSVAGDERDAYTEWNVDLTTWLHRPRRTAVFGAGGQLLRERWLSYDGQPYGVLGGGGLLTRDEARLEGARGAAGNVVVTTEYDGLGNPSAVTDARGCRTDVVYEATHRTYPATLTTCLGHVTTLTHDARWGTATRQEPPRHASESPNAQATTYEYDTLGRLTRVVGPLDTGSLYGSTTVQYLDVGTPSSQRVVTYRTAQHGTANAHWTEEYFDGLGRVRRVRSRGPAGQVVESEASYDSRGLLTSQSIPHFTGEAAALASLTYDALRRVTRVVNPDGTAATTSYAPGRTTVVDERQKTTRYFTDVFDRLVRVEEVNDAGTYATTYAYDAAGTLVQIQNHSGHVTTMEPDYLGRTRVLTDPNIGQWTFGVDASGALTHQTDARGQTLTFEYDLHGRLRAKVYPDATRVTWTYDDPTVPFSKGRLTSVADLATSTALRYDAMRRVVQTQRVLDGATYTLSQAYDGQGRVTREVFPDGDIVDYTYDEAGQLATVRNALSGLAYVSGITYNARGQRTQVQYGNGVTSTLSYFDTTADPRSFQLKRVVTSGPLGPVQDVAYGYDAADNVTAIVDAVGTGGRQYEYDALGRLTRASGPFGPGQASVAEDYAYDPVGNLLSKAGVGYSYSDPSRPSAVTARSDGRTYAYDDNGNITRMDPGRTHQWDADNQLTEVALDAGGLLQFAYDATGRRVRKTVNGGSVTRYPFPGYEIGPGGVIAKYFADVRTRSDGTTVFFHDDHLGGAHAVTGAGGAVVQAREYSPWGEESLALGSVEVGRSFTGQERDAESGLLYYGGRYYDPGLGRFLSADPVGGAPELPQSWHRYSYVANRPTRLTDPTGLSWLDDWFGWGEDGDGGRGRDSGGGRDVERDFGWNVARDFGLTLQLGGFWQSESGFTMAGPAPQLSPMQRAQELFGHAALGAALAVTGWGMTLGSGGSLSALGLPLAFYGLDYMIGHGRAALTGQPAQTLVGQVLGENMNTAIAAFSFGAASASRTPGTSTAAPVGQSGFSPPAIYVDRHGQMTNGMYTMNTSAMQPHLTGSLRAQRSQFLFWVDSNKAVLDAAAYADKFGLWRDEKAKVPVANGAIGVAGRTGQLTTWINVYRKNSRFVHGAPGNEP